MRSISASTSRAEGTPSLPSALATRSSNRLSSLSHWPAALLWISLAMLLTRLVASLMRSSAAVWVLRWMLMPSFTRVSKALPPSSCALAKAPRPASQICWAESLMAPARGEPAVPFEADARALPPFFWIFLTMMRGSCGGCCGCAGGARGTAIAAHGGRPCRPCVGDGD